MTVVFLALEEKLDLSVGSIVNALYLFLVQIFKYVVLKVVLGGECIED